MSQHIPDLRIDHNEFTIEHCSVIQSRLGAFLDEMYGPGHAEIADMLNPEAMREDLLTQMSALRLSELFTSEFGKGLLVGLFYSHFIETLNADDESED